MKPTTLKFNALTGIRCLFACMVFVYHNRKYWRADLNKYVLQFFNELHVGVSLFFVLSGFLIAYKYNDANHRKQFHYGEYIGLRVARIFPLYWLIVLVNYIDWGFPGTYRTFISLTLVHGFSDLHNLEGIAQAWSLTVEMTFYLLAPIIFFYFNKKWWKAIIFLMILFFLFWGIGECWYLINENKQHYFYPFDFMIHSTFFGRCPEFMAGVALAGLVHQDYTDRLKTWLYKTWIGFTGLMMSIFAIGFFEPDIFHHGNDTAVGAVLQYTLVPFFAVVWMYGLITEQTWMSKFFSSRLMVLLGNASFAFYLVHISYVNLRIKEWQFFPDRNFFLLWLVSILLYVAFEKPVNDGCRKLLKQKKKKQVSVISAEKIKAAS